jgi:hypothetical protein
MNYRENFDECAKRKSKKLQEAIDMAEKIMSKETTYQSSVASLQKS